MEMATLVIPETKVYDRIGDNCDVGGITWCNILSMSIGACATPSKGIRDSLGEESSSFTEGSTPAINHLRCIHICVLPSPPAEETTFWDYIVITSLVGTIRRQRKTLHDSWLELEHPSTAVA